ncbi:MAG: beta-galactosidase, partial [Victivallales bacterium]
MSSLIFSRFVLRSSKLLLVALLVSLFSSLPICASDLPTWPSNWQVFGPIPKGEDEGLDETTLSSVPKALTLKGKSYQSRSVTATDGLIDFQKVFSITASERTGAWIFSELDCPTEITLEAGAGADFWMEWFVNGKKVFDTLDEGNNSLVYDADNHRFALRLKKGKNIIAAHCLSGSAGFLVVSGGLREASATAAGPGSGKFALGDWHGYAAGLTIEAAPAPRTGEALAWKSKALSVIQYKPVNAPADWTGYQSLKFWIRADGPTDVPIRVIVSSGSGYYFATCPPPSNVWQEVSLSLNEFLSIKSPAGWNSIDKIELYTYGWTLPEPKEERVIHLMDFELEALSGGAASVSFPPRNLSDLRSQPSRVKEPPLSIGKDDRFLCKIFTYPSGSFNKDDWDADLESRKSGKPFIPKTVAGIVSSNLAHMTSLVADHPSLDGVVLLFYWSVLEPEEGKYRWEILDQALKYWGDRGKKVVLNPASIGLSVYFCEEWGGYQDALPKWVVKAGVPTLTIKEVSLTYLGLPGGSLFPLTWDEVYKEKYSAFIKKLGARYDGHPALEYVRVGTGRLGEEGAPRTYNKELGCSTFTEEAEKAGFPEHWYESVLWAIEAYEGAFHKTPLSVDLSTASFLYKTPLYFTQINTVLSHCLKNKIMVGYNGMQISTQLSIRSVNR